MPMVFDAAGFERRFRGENLDAQASKLWFRQGELVGLVLIARRGWTSRVAAMGLVVPARGQGYGQMMLQEALDEARARGERTMLLEVFAENERARRLYTRLGFQLTRPLSIFGCPAGAAAHTPPPLEELDPRQVARLLSQEADEELPWMVAPETLAALAPPVRAFQLDGKAFAIVRADPQRTLLLSLVVPRPWRRQGHGRRLLQLIMAHYAGTNLLAYMVLDGPLRALLESAGWQPQPLPLWEMECRL